MSQAFKVTKNIKPTINFQQMAWSYSTNTITMASLTKLTNLITGKLQYIPRKSVVNHQYHETK